MSDATPRRVRAVLDLPLHRQLGFRLAVDDEPGAGVVLPVTGLVVNPAGVLHGGALALLLDVTSYLALLPSLAEDEDAVTHDSALSILAAAPDGAELRLTAEILRRGRRIAFLRAEARDADRLVATAQVTKSLLRARS